MSHHQSKNGRTVSNIGLCFIPVIGCEYLLFVPAFGYLNRVLSSEQRARDQLELKMKSVLWSCFALHFPVFELCPVRQITGLSDAAFESLFAQPEAASERPLTHDHSSAAFTMSFRTGSST
jgi:hypothetical protein